MKQSKTKKKKNKRIDPGGNWIPVQLNILNIKGQKAETSHSMPSWSH